MERFDRPKILVSRCLGFEPVRWNGIVIQDDFIKKLARYVDFVTVCPEVEIGLGVPRDPIRIVKKDKSYFLIQHNTEKDITDRMEKFSKHFLKNQIDFDGVILKEKSPSCGIKNVKVYNKDGNVVENGSGFFAKNVLELYPDIPLESEGRLKNMYLKENFLTKIFLISGFRKLEKNMKELINFHSKNKYLFLAYNQRMLRDLGKIVANHENYLIDTVFLLYEQVLLSGLKINYRRTSFYNTFLHILGYFKDRIKKDEKDFILENLDEFKNEKLDLTTVLKLLQSYVIRFDIEYLKGQTIFKPFPKNLI
ncbi:MAG: DUF523 and DUF1722 domain-containing protein [candidate division WOR-3 bacterium]